MAKKITADEHTQAAKGLFKERATRNLYWVSRGSDNNDATVKAISGKSGDEVISFKAKSNEWYDGISDYAIHSGTIFVVSGHHVAKIDQSAVPQTQAYKKHEFSENNFSFVACDSSSVYAVTYGSKSPVVVSYDHNLNEQWSNQDFLGYTRSIALSSNYVYGLFDYLYTGGYGEETIVNIAKFDKSDGSIVNSFEPDNKNYNRRICAMDNEYVMVKNDEDPYTNEIYDTSTGSRVGLMDDNTITDKFTAGESAFYGFFTDNLAKFDPTKSANNNPVWDYTDGSFDSSVLFETITPSSDTYVIVRETEKGLITAVKDEGSSYTKVNTEKCVPSERDYGEKVTRSSGNEIIYGGDSEGLAIRFDNPGFTNLNVGVSGFDGSSIGVNDKSENNLYVSMHGAIAKVDASNGEVKSYVCESLVSSSFDSSINFGSDGVAVSVFAGTGHGKRKNNVFTYDRDFNINALHSIELLKNGDSYPLEYAELNDDETLGYITMAPNGNYAIAFVEGELDTDERYFDLLKLSFNNGSFSRDSRSQIRSDTTYDGNDFYNPQYYVNSIKFIEEDIAEFSYHFDDDQQYSGDKSFVADFSGSGYDKISAGIPHDLMSSPDSVSRTFAKSGSNASESNLLVRAVGHEYDPNSNTHHYVYVVRELPGGKIIAQGDLGNSNPYTSPSLRQPSTLVNEYIVVNGRQIETRDLATSMLKSIKLLPKSPSPNSHQFTVDLANGLSYKDINDNQALQARIDNFPSKGFFD